MTSAEAKSGVIFVMIGPGGAGKNAIMKAVIGRYANITQLATATTRAMRPDEKQGLQHHFLSVEAFQQKIQDGLLLEYQEVTPGKFYGIPRQMVTESLAQGRIEIADIDVLGAQKLVEAFPQNVVQIFVTVPGDSIEEQLALLETRMRQRDDGATDIQERLERAKDLELPYQTRCDYILVNDNLEHAIAKAQLIIRRELRNRKLLTLDLRDYHRQLGARLASDGIPLDYGDPGAEFMSALRGAILLDRSHEARLLLKGKSRFELVNRMSTNDIVSMDICEGRATVFTNANGRILFRALCYNLSQGLLLVGEAGQGAQLENYLRRNMFFGDDVQVENLSDSTAQFAVHGAAAAQIRKNLGIAVSQLPLLQAAEADIDGTAVTIARRKSIADDHWIVICPRQRAVEVHRHLLKIGAESDLTPAGSLTYNLLRIRSGRPAGLELSASYIPLEVGLWDEVSFNKGCYTGQEIIARMESRQRLAKLLVKLTLSEFVPSPADVYAGARVVGRLTSSAQAPDGQIFALAVIKLQQARAGSRLCVGERRISAHVAEYAGVQPEFVDTAADNRIEGTPAQAT